MIGQVSLRNFKCFEYERIKTRELTLFAGINGTGKSSVLQAILLLRQSYLDGLLPGKGIELNGPLIRLGTAKDVFYEDAQTEEFEIGFAWRREGHSTFKFQYDATADVLNLLPGKREINTFQKPPFSDNFHYLQAERLGPRVTNILSEYEVKERRQIGIAGEYTQHFLNTYEEETVDTAMLHPGTDNPSLRNQVQAWLRDICPGTEYYLDPRPDADVILLRYSFVFGEQRSNKYRPTAVGFGITYALPVIVAILSSKRGYLILIENPEAHLHPQGQVKIGELLARAASAGVQTIVETHSDHILNGIRVAVRSGLVKPKRVALNYFSRKELEGRVFCKVESPAIDADGRINTWPEGFFDEWEKNLEQLF